MGKAKINFEVDEEHLAKAKAYVALHGGSLNKLVNTLFANLGNRLENRLEPDKKILVELSSGKISLMEATKKLRYPDAGYTLHRMAEEGLPVYNLPENVVSEQASDTLSALRDALRQPSDKTSKASVATK